MRETRGTAVQDWSGRWLLALALLFTAIYLLYYPRTYSVLDEQGFLSFAMVLAKGTLKADEAGIFVVRQAIVNGHAVPAVGLGTVVLLLPAVLIHWQTAYLLMLGVHLLGFWAASRALAHAGLPRLYAALYLLFPPAALYARTAMSDLPTAVLTLCGLWAYLARPRRPLWAGVLWGFTPFFRFAQAPFLLGLGLARLAKDLLAWRRTGNRDLWPVLYLGLGMVPGLGGWMLVNTWLYGGPFDTPVLWPLSTQYLPSHLWRYLLMLNLLYPLMLTIAVIRPSPLRAEIIWSGLATLTLYSLFKHRYEGFGPAGAIIGYRFFLPLFALLLIPYASALERGRRALGRTGKPAAWAGLGLLLVGYVGMSWAHDRRLAAQEQVQQAIYAATADAELVLVDQGAREFFLDALGKRELLYVEAFPFPAAVRQAVARAVPAVLVVTLEREDMSIDVTTGKLLAELRRSYTVEQTATLGRKPDHVRIYRVLARGAP
ncbi:MAG: hypothetical protein E4H17_02030 [Gemmatimonadales bacterium]|nr:MAG: hypothetical protein E4H17_02030 [Gemmatimonadales bacterium]